MANIDLIDYILVIGYKLWVYDKTGELPTGRGGVYEKVDAKTAKPLPRPLQPVNKSEMLFLDYLNEWVQVHRASIQPATFISYNRMITGRITQYFEPLGLKLCEVTPQVLDEFQEKILLEGYTTNTVIHYHAIFGKAFKDAVRKDYLETNPMLKVDHPKKNSFRPNFVTEHFEWLLTKYGLKHIRFHDLRHSCASLLLANGVPMKQVQEWLGHSTFSTTADIYAHLDYKSKQGSAGVIAGLLDNSSSSKKAP